MTTPHVHSRLGSIKKGPLDVADRVFIYGTEGIGKSTLAAHAPDPVFFDLEDGTSQLDVARYPFRDEPGGYVPHKYEEILAGIRDLTEHEHNFKSLVLDTLDRLEGLIWTWILERDSSSGTFNKGGKPMVSIESYGYQKGYTIALDEWRHLAERLDVLRLRRNLHIISLGHAQVRTYKNPEGEDYDRFQPSIHTLAAGFWKSWNDITGFASFEGGGAKVDPADKKARPKGYSTGRRILRTAHDAAFDAKSRIALPKEIELDIANPWGPFAAAMSRGHSMPTTEIVGLINVELERLGDEELTKKVHRAIAAAAKDRSKLAMYLSELQGRQPQEQETTNE